MSVGDAYLAWLRDDALPLWSERGVDRLSGGFFEKLQADGTPEPLPRRARVLGRQIYVFSRASLMGWDGPAADLVNHGLDALPRFRREDGLFHYRLDEAGQPLDARPDLYDQAFILFGLAHALPLAQDRAAVIDVATSLRQALNEVRAHPGGGFDEDRPATVPLKANPHMHMLEAALAWAAVLPDDEAAPWTRIAEELVTLALNRFVDPETGAVREYYDADWRALPAGDDAQIEPGHQFEWGWLLTRWGVAQGDARALEAGRRLVDLGEAHGIDAARGVAFGGLTPALSPCDPVARLWPQTERIKAWVQRRDMAATDAERSHAEQRLEAALAGLVPYLRVDRPGLFHDRMTADGRFIDEPAPASSLYHLMTAAEELAHTRPDDPSI
ncbi:AGE family epimerase/isomerase [Brevundimonas sp. A19_0]|uniref:AGE family epimerase/isomerase n=1 Tax=Brevundimonas sp. A19_0 TaxID=2821087 RepID=UPI001ADB9EA8|nr:AGE family epimerase/isomerase [Brevundimonas sp. A19_0]MBO9500316.1 AGE family epimerase/isomerase [Brevundimonas sp. A19_0]